jgi:ornithine cyclodeaminase
VAVWGRDSQRAQAVAHALRDEGIDAREAPDLAQAVAAAQVITCATTSGVPLVRGAWLAPGTHLDLVGGFRRDMREVDDAAVARARVVVDTYAGALAEAGDLVQPIEAGVVGRDHVLADLAQLLRCERAGRLADSDVTQFKSVGTALEDLAAARLVAGA